MRPSVLTEVEKVLLRALAITDPEYVESRRIASEALCRQPQWFESLRVSPTLHVLAERGTRDPMEVVENEEQRALLAEALLAETEPPSDVTVMGAIVSLQQRQIESQLRGMRTQIAEAERRGDFNELALLTQRKLELDRALRQLQRVPEGL